MITSHPQDVQIQQGYKVTLDVITDESVPLSYQWYFEGDKIDGKLNHCAHYMPIMSCFIGENNPSYTIHPVTVSNAGHYYCQIENQYGVVNSTVATVIVTTLSTTKHLSLGKSLLYIARYLFGPTIIILYYITRNSCNIGMSSLPDMHARSTDK